MKSIYLDNAATTKLAPEVADAMIPVLSKVFGNPSSSHSVGRKAKALIETQQGEISLKFSDASLGRLHLLLVEPRLITLPCVLPLLT